ATLIGTVEVTKLSGFMDSGGAASEFAGSTSITWSGYRSLWLMLGNAALYVVIARLMSRWRYPDSSVGLRTIRATRGQLVGAGLGGVLLAIFATIILSVFTPEESSPMQHATLIPGSMLAT